MPWNRLADLPWERDYLAAVAIEGRGILLLGGVPSRGGATTVAQRRRVDLYDPLTDSYTQLPDMAVAVTKCRAARVGDEVVAFGIANGEGGDGLIVQIMDLADDTWATNAAWKLPDYDSCGFPPEPSDTYAIVVDGDDVTVLAGIQNCQDSEWDKHSVTRFNVPGRSWAQISNDPSSTMPHPVSSSAAAILDGIAYLFGGDDWATMDATSVWTQRLDMSTDNWLADGADIEPREVADADAIVVDGEIWVIGAYPTGPEVLLEGPVQIYNPVSDSWREGESVPEFKIDHAAVVYDGMPYVFGGEDNELEYTHAWQYEAPEPVVGQRRYVDASNGNPAHIFAHRTGGACSIPLGNWRAREKANGGLIGATARARQSDIEANSHIFRADHIMRTVERETGRVIFHGYSKPPGYTGGVVDISADGVGTHLANKECETLLFASDDYSLWESLTGDESNLAPDDAIGDYSVINIGLGFLAMGTYKYVVTFVTADGETTPGPEMSATVGADDELANIRLKEIPIGGPAVTARKIYRRDPGFGAEEYRLVTTINDNTTEEYTDNDGDVSTADQPPHSHVAEGVICSVHDDHLQIDIGPGVNVYDDQIAGFVWYVRRADAQRIRMVVAQSRAASNYEIRVAAADDRRGPWSLEETVDLASPQAKKIDPPAVFDKEDVDAIRIIVKRKTDGSDALPLSITIRKLRVYGVAEDDEFTTSDGVRAVCSALGISDGGVHSTGVPCLPQLFRNVQWSAILDLMALLSGHWRWLFHVDEDNVVCDFAEYKRRRWGLVAPADTIPLPRYSRVVVEDPDGRELAEAVAKPNPLGYRKTAPPIRLPFRVSREVAQNLADIAVEDYVAEAWAGSARVTKVLNENGQLVPHTRVRGGDQVLEPRLGVYLDVDEVDREHHISTLTFAGRTSRVDRFVARLERKRTVA